jgi:hypothetical protein
VSQSDEPSRFVSDELYLAVLPAIRLDGMAWNVSAENFASPCTQAAFSGYNQLETDFRPEESSVELGQRDSQLVTHF